MGVLPNHRWELMAQGLASGKKQFAAYRDAGFKVNSRSAAKLANHPDIVGRIDELMQVALANTGVTVERIITELAKLGFSNMLDFIKIDDDGQPCLDFNDLDREKAAAIAEITTDVITNPRDGSVTRRTRFKLYDKKTALVDLGRHLGMFKETKDVNLRGVVFHVNKSDMAL
jgi:phage terminase small subunit